MKNTLLHKSKVNDHESNPDASPTNVVCTLTPSLNGQLYTRLRLIDLQNIAEGYYGQVGVGFAEKEIERREIVETSIYISGHAINRASQYLLRFYMEETEGEGILSWLINRSEKAVKLLKKDSNTVSMDGIKFVFSKSTHPQKEYSLQSVM
jgi:hypothetical protein